MDGSQQSTTIAALDIGTSKITVAVATVSDEEGLELKGFGKVPSKGIHAGSVQDVELAVESIRQAVSEAEAMSGLPIQSVYAALTGKYLRSVNKVGRLVLPASEVTPSDVKRVTQLAKAFDPKNEPNPITGVVSDDDRVVAHVTKGYTLDSDETILQDPLGMSGSVLKANVHLAIGSDSTVLNLVKCIRRAGLDVEGLVLQPWASAASCLTPTEKELGVILLDIGASTIDVCCYVNGQIELTHVLVAGGDLLSRDIAAWLGCTLEDAEDIKLTYSHIGVREGDRYERIRYTYEPDGSEKVVACEELVNIVEARAAELLMYIKQYALDPDNWLQRAAAGIVITGGGTNMEGFRELAQRTFMLPVRQGSPQPLGQGPLQLQTPADATVIGVLHETVRRRRMSGQMKTSSSRLSGVWDGLKRIVFGDFWE